MTLPRRPSRKLTKSDAIKVWKLREKGWLQHRIAAEFDVNQGRISEIITGKIFPESREIAGVI